MSTYPTHGAGGKILVADEPLAMLTSWSIQESVGVGPVRFAGATDLVKLSDGMIDASISVEAVLNAGDDAQASLVAGAAVLLDLYVDAGAPGDHVWSCSAIVESRGIDLTIDGAVTTSFTLAVNGAITKGTVPTPP